MLYCKSAHKVRRSPGDAVVPGTFIMMESLRKRFGSGGAVPEGDTGSCLTLVGVQDVAPASLMVGSMIVQRSNSTKRTLCWPGMMAEDGGGSTLAMAAAQGPALAAVTMSPSALLPQLLLSTVAKRATDCDRCISYLNEQIASIAG